MGVQAKKAPSDARSLLYVVPQPLSLRDIHIRGNTGCLSVSLHVYEDADNPEDRDDVVVFNLECWEGFGILRDAGQ